MFLECGIVVEISGNGTDNVLSRVAIKHDVHLPLTAKVAGISFRHFICSLVSSKVL